MKADIYLKPTIKHRFFEMIRIIARFFILLTKGGKGLKLFLYYNSPKFIRSFLWKFHNLSLDHLTDSHLEKSPFKAKLREFKENGVIKFAEFDRDFIDSVISEFNIDYSVNQSIDIDFKSHLLNTIIKDTMLVEFISDYYGSQAYLRENPTIQVLNKSDPALQKKPSKIFHADGYRQISFMLLLNDLSEEDIYMEYCISTHKKQQKTYDRRLLNQAAIEKSFSIFKLIEKKGAMFLFDTEGFHRGNYNLDLGSSKSYRVLMHANFHPGIYSKISI